MDTDQEEGEVDEPPERGEEDVSGETEDDAELEDRRTPVCTVSGETGDFSPDLVP